MLCSAASSSVLVLFPLKVSRTLVSHGSDALLAHIYSVSAAMDFRASLDGVCAQDNTLKSLTLPPKKNITFHGDLQEPPAKPQLIHKQPPALPPKPFSRLTNHSTGDRHLKFKTFENETTSFNLRVKGTKIAYSYESLENKSFC